MQPAGHKSEGLFTKEDFRYDEAADVYICPVGHHLKPRRFHQHRQMTDYVADKNQAANLHHFKRARWRRLWRQQIQDWLIAAVQNVVLLCGGAAAVVPARPRPSPKVRRTAVFFAVERITPALRASIFTLWRQNASGAYLAA